MVGNTSAPKWCQMHPCGNCSLGKIFVFVKSKKKKPLLSPQNDMVGRCKNVFTRTCMRISQQISCSVLMVKCFFFSQSSATDKREKDAWFDILEIRWVARHNQHFVWWVSFHFVALWGNSAEAVTFVSLPNLSVSRNTAESYLPPPFRSEKVLYITNCLGLTVWSQPSQE